MAISVAFDLDDTLYKEIDFVKSGYRAIAAAIGAENAYGIMFGAFERKENPFDALKNAIDTTFSDKEMVAIYREHKPDIKLPEAAKNTLKSLKEAGCRLSLITDGRSITQRNKIASLGLTDFFEEIFISEEQGADKFIPDSFLAVRDKFPDAEAFWYVGDNLAKDFFHPNKLGWGTICLKDEGVNIHSQDIEVAPDYKPGIYISKIEEIIGIIIK